MPTILLFTLCTVFAEPRLGKVQAKRLEEDAKSCTKCRYVYSFLADAAAVPQCSPLMVDPTDRATMAAVMLLLSQRSSHMRTERDKASTL